MSSPSSPRHLVVPVRAPAFLVMPAPNMHLRPIQPCPSETCSARHPQARMRLLQGNAAPRTGDLGRPKMVPVMDLLPLSLVALFGCQGIPTGEVNPNSQNVRLIVGTSGLQSGKVVVDSTMTLAAGERTTFSVGLVPNRPEMSLVPFPAFGCTHNCTFLGISSTTSPRRETRLACQQTPTRYRR